MPMLPASSTRFAGHRDRRAQGVEDALGDDQHVVALGEVRQQEDELVARQAGHGVLVADAPAEPLATAFSSSSPAA